MCHLLIWTFSNFEHFVVFLFCHCCFVYYYYTVLNISLNLRLFPHESFTVNIFIALHTYCQIASWEACESNYPTNVYWRCLFFNFCVAVTRLSQMEVRGKKNATAGLQGGFGTACRASRNLDKPKLVLQPNLHHNWQNFQRAERGQREPWRVVCGWAGGGILTVWNQWEGKRQLRREGNRHRRGAQCHLCPFLNSSEDWPWGTLPFGFLRD